MPVKRPIIAGGGKLGEGWARIDKGPSPVKQAILKVLGQFWAFFYVKVFGERQSTSNVLGRWVAYRGQGCRSARCLWIARKWDSTVFPA